MLMWPRDKQNGDLIGQLVSRGVGLMECLGSGLDFTFFFLYGSLLSQLLRKLG